MKKHNSKKCDVSRSAGEWADEIAAGLKPYVSGSCEGFFDSFDHTTTGNNRTHPLMLGKLAQVLWELDGIEAVAIDARLNRGDGVKFQPDFVAYDSAVRPILAVDYESPNSSDARVPIKDIMAYRKWSENSADAMRYVIITTLPDARCDAWQLRYTGRNQYNCGFGGHVEEMRRNPFKFWYAHYKRETHVYDMRSVAMLNISGKRINRSLV